MDTDSTAIPDDADDPFDTSGPLWGDDEEIEDDVPDAEERPEIPRTL